MAVRVMRVTGGQFRGRRLRAPRGPDTRPATGRVRESVFSALGATVVGARVLDLYAGAGTLGIEALSRGGDSVVFVEKSRAAVGSLRWNLRSVGAIGTTRVISQSVERFLSHPREGDRFDIVFADPPWDISSEQLAGILARVTARLNAEALVVVTRRAGDGVPVVDGLEVANRRRHGDAQIIRYVKE